MMNRKKKPLNTNFIFLMLGRMVSDTGAGIQSMIIPLYIIDTGGSAATVGLFSFLSLVDDPPKIAGRYTNLNFKRVMSVNVPSDEEIKAAAEIINKSERPVIYAGGGIKISGAEKELLEFAEKASIPVSESLMGRDVFPANHPLCTWMVGMHGTRASNMAVTESDLVLALGSG